ncbi:MAG: hypothetical protein EAZ45_18005 [Oscillatoriales cyanobacterium]|nr:MAG: hypothetical protein EAZ45_18005 [Oscillatoriales cyanobacterium]
MTDLAKTKIIKCRLKQHYPLPITHYQLPITNYQLPITNYTNYPLPPINCDLSKSEALPIRIP